MPLAPFYSPLRYPGGKRKLVEFMRLVFEENRLSGSHYVEPYCGGAAVGLALLFGEYADEVHINDVSRAVYAFWDSVLNRTDELCAQIGGVALNMREWRRQRKVQEHSETAPLLELGFSTFFLNRTNRSGILSGGVIGGREQRGRWKLGARFNKEELIRRIRRIARYGDRIHLYNLDASDFLTEVYPTLPPSLAYLDPPYYSKGDALYRNSYSEEDHRRIAEQVRNLESAWIVSYDSVPAILDLYKGHTSLHYSLSYSAQRRFKGSEVAFLSKGLRLPSLEGEAEESRTGHPRQWRIGALYFDAGLGGP